jgi:hypothetical protein
MYRLRFERAGSPLRTVVAVLLLISGWVLLRRAEQARIEREARWERESEAFHQALADDMLAFEKEMEEGRERMEQSDIRFMRSINGIRAMFGLEPEEYARESRK